jgi:hypothetical protein
MQPISRFLHPPFSVVSTTKRDAAKYELDDQGVQLHWERPNVQRKELHLDGQLWLPRIVSCYHDRILEFISRQSLGVPLVQLLSGLRPHAVEQELRLISCNSCQLAKATRITRGPTQHTGSVLGKVSATTEVKRRQHALRWVECIDSAGDDDAINSPPDLGRLRTTSELEMKDLGISLQKT